ncbi:hypothetical protein DFH28DRAFT_879059, partial [Melampsora americana]
WICSPWNSPDSISRKRTKPSSSESSFHTPPSTPPSLLPRCCPGLDPCGRLMEHHRKSHLDQAQKRITASIQDKRRSQLCQLREALYLIYTYSGPYLQLPGNKRKAARFLRSQDLAAEFVEKFDDDAKWEWLNNQVKTLR